MGLTTCTGVIYEAFLSEDRLKTLFHGHSYTANPIACAAGLASLELTRAPSARTNGHALPQPTPPFGRK
ncbi:hypothetical protein [Hymenobacter volaticus]|uniref:Aminotransferase class III-fold pyridoxal phosphate-dependent enzyme n=1 Tax=Hymenobacter volaticus TaxID=2932254 RepID=A0ABY4GCL9_9BACT|nr:hypothetical protein [Hymenobacter volaticus]UOQ68546.1 hypothetical protein MUN86_07250 [Hymenobacter volaticus]